ncbi:MAG: hypothetical protein ACK4G3_02230 [bacterium]
MWKALIFSVLAYMNQSRFLFISSRVQWALALNSTVVWQMGSAVERKIFLRSEKGMPIEVFGSVWMGKQEG